MNKFLKDDLPPVPMAIIKRPMRGPYKLGAPNGLMLVNVNTDSPTK
jgi:hypothetical protein